MKRLIIVLIVLALVIPLASAQEFKSSEIRAPAISSEGKGILTHIEVEIIPGKGRVLLNSVPLTGIQTQNSERVAVSVAQNFTGANLSDYDVIFTFRTEAFVIEGPSAGAAMTTAVIAAIQNKSIREDASITGTILSDGTIGYVSGIIEKATAVASAGDKFFLIPKGVEMQPYIVEKVETPAPGWTIVRRETEYINATKYAAENLNLTLVQVSTIAEVVDILIEGKNVTALIEVTPQKSFLERIEVLERVAPMESMAENEIRNAENTIENARTIIEELNESLVVDTLKILLNDSQDELEKAKTALHKGYLYGAANHAFRANIHAKYVRDLTKHELLEEGKKTEFIGERIEEVNSKLEKTREELKDVNELTQDMGAWEWAVSAQERFAQAEEQLSRKSNVTASVLYTLALTEEWLDISSGFYKIAKNQITGEELDLGAFEEKSALMITKAEFKLEELSEEQVYGAGWCKDVAQREYDKGWYLAAYIDAGNSIKRIKTKQELEQISWDNLVSKIKTEIEAKATSNSVWGILYKDYAEFSLYYAEKEQSTSELENALLYVRLAEHFSDVSKEVGVSEKQEVKEVGVVRDYRPVVLLISILIIAVLFTTSKSFKKRLIQSFIPV